MYRREDAEAMRVCLDKGIKVVPVPLSSDGRTLALEIHRRGRRPQRGKEVYTIDTITDKIIWLYHKLK